jgi:hypothetical protein
MTALRLRIGIVVLTMLLAVACGGGSQPAPRVAGISATPSASATTSVDPLTQRKQDWLAWVACLRQHGANEPDPSFDANGNPQFAVSLDSLPQPAKQACQPLLQKVSTGKGQGRKPTDAEMAQLRQFASCMRQHGVPNFSDPDPQNGTFTVPGFQGNSWKADPTAHAAAQACAQFLPKTG